MNARTAPPHDLLWHSPGLDRKAVRTAVCIPTFRRPEGLAATLRSLARQTDLEGVAVVIAENDAGERAGAGVARAALDGTALAGVCVLEATQGNCAAINAAFGTALALFPRAERFLMIDDDEVAEPGWIAGLVAVERRTGADIVGGPVRPRFPGGPAPLQRHAAFATLERPSGPVPLIYGSGNCLITRRVFEGLALPRFDLAYNHLGGGDTEFFVRAREAGFSFAWAAEAVAHESVPAARLDSRWLTRRSMRIGAVNARIDRERLGWPRLWAKNGAVLAAALPRAIREGWRTRSLVCASHPPLVALGRVLAGLGIEAHQYRAG